MPNKRSEVGLENKSIDTEPDHESIGTSGMLPGWHSPKPETLPKPTYWPVVMAFGITFLAMGFVTTLLISGVGLVLFVMALARWIGELQHER
jgi:hypothetical protein